MWKRIRKPLGYLGAILALAFIGIQFVPVDRSNPPVTMELPASPEVLAVLRQSCYDCHSNSVHWPWYSYVAPVSWLVAKDVREGRHELNFSIWDQYSPRKRARKIEECIELAEKGEMPLPIYLTMHADARLTTDDLNTLRAWAEATKAAAESAPDSPPQPKSHDD